MKIIEGKLVLLGSQGVGKTSLITQYAGKLLNHVNPTIGASFFTCKINIGDTRVKLQVWDTAGQERFRSMAPMYYRNANIAVLVFDITQYNTFTAMKSWVNELHRNIENQIILIVVGNKSDLVLQRKVTFEEAQKYATSIDATYHEISALHADGIEKVFIFTALALLRSNNEDHHSDNLKITDLPNSEIVNFDSEYPLTPSSEEILANSSIAHGIHEKPYACC